MISKQHFKKGTKSCYCDDYEQIENYELAIMDTEHI